MYNLYYLKSSIDEKIYIGITNNPEKRYKDHLKYSSKKEHHNGRWISKVLREGGEIKMTIILKNISMETAVKAEVKMIEMLRRLIPTKITNTAQGGLGFNHKGIPHSEEHKKNLATAQPHKLNIDREELYDLYVNKKLSKATIGKMLGRGPTTIDRALKRLEIPIRVTPNYKVSYKINKEEVIDMYVNKGMSMLSISQTFGIGCNGVRHLLKREGIDTKLNLKKGKNIDRVKLKERYLELIEDNKKVKTYEILSEEFGICAEHVYRIIFH